MDTVATDIVCNLTSLLVDVLLILLNAFVIWLSPIIVKWARAKLIQLVGENAAGKIENAALDALKKDPAKDKLKQVIGEKVTARGTVVVTKGQELLYSVIPAWERKILGGEVPTRQLVERVVRENNPKLYDLLGLPQPDGASAQDKGF